MSRTYEKIIKNDYNLSVSTYVEKEDLTPPIDIDEVNKELATTVEKITLLRADIDEIVKELSRWEN